MGNRRLMTGRGMLAVWIAVMVAGCDVSMTQQPKLKTYEPSAIWPDGTSARPLPENVVAQGDLERDAAAVTRPAITLELLERGRERFGIFCAPCHGLDGYADGMIVKRGFPRPPSYHSRELLAASAQHFYDVMTNGYGVMYSYAARVEPADRWAIAAYIRALQLSGHARADQAPEGLEKLR